MQTQQPKQQKWQQTNGAQPKGSPQPWVKPTFERLPLNEALAGLTYVGSGPDATSYAS